MFDSWPSSSDPSKLVSDTVRVDPLQGLTALRSRHSVVRRRLSARLKRAFDFTAALFAILMLAPAFLAVAAAVAMETRGPIFFRQRRTGLGGRIFVILKFRTMSVVEDGEVIAHASRNDSRVTRVGAVLRETSLDELPQLINILRGDMSFVGPRPHALAHDQYYGALIPSYAGRFAVRPGLTGLAQSRGLRGEIHQLDCMARRVAADAEYADSWSFRGDFMIMLDTVPQLVRRVNAY